ncbi:YdcH family protein [Allorhizobium undicola]|uniref:YdcH family protein n=1 Tax=Allorhizobium undicola TaxID=78527 RepID=UPI003D353DB7
MTIQAHLDSLAKKHGALEEKLHAALSSPSSDDNEILEIKRLKLRIKDEMERLKKTRH